MNQVPLSFPFTDEKAEAQRGQEEREPDPNPGQS